METADYLMSSPPSLAYLGLFLKPVDTAGRCSVSLHVCIKTRNRYIHVRGICVPVYQTFRKECEWF